MVSKVIPVEDFDLVIFGGTGDLTRRKILPALFRRSLAGQIPQTVRILATARGTFSQKEYQEFARQALGEFIKGFDEHKAEIDQFIAQLDYVELDVLGTKGWVKLKNLIRDNVITVFYFSVGPALFGPLSERLVTHKISAPNSRIVVEKPFGRDLATAKLLNQELGACFDEKQIYRIDHYLGKETVQNLMAIRFANALFEPLWNAHHVDHVQITVAESIGVKGRGEYYDKSGAIRDMLQNHLLQLLCLTAMEPPSTFEADAVRAEKQKVIQALDDVDPHDIVRDQYRASSDEPSYLGEVHNPNSHTESFIALKVKISNWRWAGTPFYLRTGKRLRARMSEIAITFKEPPHCIFPQNHDSRGNVRVMRLQPDEGITLRVMIKDPGPGGMRLTEVPLDMTFAKLLGNKHDEMPDAYERLIMDVVRGDQTLFMRGDEVEAAWAWTDRIVATIESNTQRPSEYDSGGSGPEDALMLIHRDKRRWREIEV